VKTAAQLPNTQKQLSTIATVRSVIRIPSGRTFRSVSSHRTVRPHVSFCNSNKTRSLS